MQRQVGFALFFAVIIGIGIFLFLTNGEELFPGDDQSVDILHGVDVDTNGSGVSTVNGGSGSSDSDAGSNPGNDGSGKTGTDNGSSGNNGLPGAGGFPDTNNQGGGGTEAAATAQGEGTSNPLNKISNGSPQGLRPFKGIGSGMLAAQVLDEEGETYPDVSILLSASQGDMERVTDSDGLAVFGKLPQGRYTLSVESGDQFQGKTSSISLARGEEKRVILRCSSKEHVISGRALDSDGNILFGVVVQLRPDNMQDDIIDLWTFSEHRLKTTTNREGFYIFEDLPGGTFHLSAQWIETGEKKNRKVSSPSTAEDFVFNPPLEIEITGRCEDKSGNIIENATVSVLGRNVVVAHTDKNGFYSLITKSASWSGTIHLRAQKQKYKKQQKSISLSKEALDQGLVIDFVLEKVEGEGEIAGVLMDNEGNFVSNETVLLVSSRQKVQKHSRSDADGNFFFNNLEEGDDYRLSVFPQKSYRDLRKTGISVADGEVVDIELVLERIDVGVVQGVAYNGNNQPLTGFAFRIRSDQSWSQDLRVVTASDGSFRKEDVPAGNILFDTWATPHFSIRGLKLEAGEEKDIRLVFGAGDKKAEGIVQTGDNQVVSGAKVVMSWVKKSGGLISSVQHSTVTDNSGWYRVSDLAPGEYRIQVRATGLKTSHFTKQLSSDGKWNFVLETLHD